MMKTGREPREIGRGVNYEQSRSAVGPNATTA